MDWHAALRAFVAVVDQGGFAPAARRSGLATSSLTRQIDALEAHLGVSLLNRSTRSVTLTAAGEAYHAQVRRILDDLDEANRAVSEGSGPPRGVLRISLPVSFARLHVTPFLPRFMAEYPAITLDVVSSDDVINLVERRIDVAVRLGALDPSSLIARRLAPHRRVLCASPAYLAAHGVPDHPRDLTQHSCLAFAFAPGDRTWSFCREGRVETVRARGTMRANDADMLHEAALAGHGLVLMPTWFTGEDLAQGRLVPVLPGWRAELGPVSGPVTLPVDPGIHAVYLPDRRNSPKVRAFVDFLAARFGSPPYWDRWESLRGAQS